jgi:hypothetical protein
VLRGHVGRSLLLLQTIILHFLRSCDRQRIVANFFVIKPTRSTNFSNLFLSWNSTCFGQFLCPSSGVYSLYTVQQWYMSYRQLSSRNICSCSKAVYKLVWHIPLLSVHWINSWWWTDELSETCRVSWQNKFVKLVHLFGSITKKFGGCFWVQESLRGCGWYSVAGLDISGVEHLVSSTTLLLFALGCVRCAHRYSHPTKLPCS